MKNLCELTSNSPATYQLHQELNSPIVAQRRALHRGGRFSNRPLNAYSALAIALIFSTEPFRSLSASVSCRMIHEKQVRQLCAVHTVNNLLQIPSDFDWCDGDGDEKSNNDLDTSYSASTTQENKTVDKDNTPRLHSDRTIHRWTCSSQVLHQLEQPPSSIPTAADKRWRAATQAEFDEIAQEITIRERLLMEGKLSITCSDENHQTRDDYMSSSTQNLSALQRIFSHHGTPFLGNYSLEVMQVALKRRGVVMEYFRVSDVDAVVEVDNDASNTAKISSLHVGYIVYDHRNSFSSYLKRIGRNVPILKHFCQGKHWYAITRVCYHSKEINASLKTCKSSINDIELNKTENKSTVSWYLIDSKLNEPLSYDSDKQLLQDLRQIQDSGGLVFRASFCIPPSAETQHTITS